MRRVRLGLIASACLLVCRAGMAQGWPPLPMEGRWSPGQPMQPDPNVHPAGWQQAGWHGQPPTAACPPGAAPPIAYQLLPGDRGFIYDHDSRLDLTLRGVMRGSWFRLEYLNWNVSPPEHALLGAPTTLAANPSRPFSIPFNDPLNPTPQTGLAVVPTTGDVDGRDVDGIKGSFGIPITKYAWFEGSAWSLSQTSDFIDVGHNLPAAVTLQSPTPVQFVVTPLLTDGAPGTELIIYDQSFSGFYQANAWSGELNLVFNTRVPDEGWTFQPLIGFKHTEYSEKLSFGGSFSNISGFNVGAPVIANPVMNRIESNVSNWQYSMQFGFRTEFILKHLTFGIVPKIAFGSNYSRASVLTNNLREPGDVTGMIDDPLVITADNRVVFAPTFDLGVYAKIHLTEWMNLHVGYNLMWLGRVSTAERNIFYNDTGDQNPPQVTVSQHFGSHVIDGISVGGEIILP